VTAGPLLTRVLWQQAASVLITSATINAGDNFRGFTREVALPETGIALALPSPFDYATQAELLVPALGVPHTLRDEHARAIANWMEQRLDWDAGNLVLFTSRAKMRIAMESLPAHLRDRCRVQGDKAKVLLVDEHMDEIRAGRGSTLVGLASFGEGLDLPGDACTTVVVTQLPFTVPTDPVSATLSAWFEAKGRNPFIEISVPEATRTLVQYCGRLIRSENDRGRVVILDRRLVEKRYGNGMLQALPPFRRSVERAA
jgi:ATP-dependent DNA helicase DinG